MYRKQSSRARIGKQGILSAHAPPGGEHEQPPASCLNSKGCEDAGSPRAFSRSSADETSALSRGHFAQWKDPCRVPIGLSRNVSTGKKCPENSDRFGRRTEGSLLSEGTLCDPAGSYRVAGNRRLRCKPSVWYGPRFYS